MLNIYLTRHGQDQDNANGILNGRRDTPLTEIGFSQAKQLAEKIKSSGIVFDKIFASPLKRTFQTAQIISKVLQTRDPQKLDLLIERDFGVMTGEPLAKIIEMCAPDILETENVTYFLSPKDAETFPQLMERAKRLLSWLNDKYKEGNILLVSHGDIGKMIYAQYYNLDWHEVLRMFYFGNSDLLLLSPNSPASEPYVFTSIQSNK